MCASGLERVACHWGQQRVRIAASLEVSGRQDAILSGNLCGSSDMQLEVKVLGLLSFSVTVVWCVTQVKSPNSFVFWFILSVKWGIVVMY